MRRADLRQTFWGGSSQGPVSGAWSSGPGPRKCSHPWAFLERDCKWTVTERNTRSQIRSSSHVLASCFFFTDFRALLEITAFGRRRFSQRTAGNRRVSQKLQETAEFCRNLFVPMASSLLLLTLPYFITPLPHRK